VTVRLCVLLWAVPGNEAALVAYEDAVLALLPAHGAHVAERLRTREPCDGPYEVHVIEFPTEATFDAYMNDPARQARSAERDAAIARTEVLRVDPVRR
jgi:uncharacterized protein (DUF1330 family)